MIGGTNNFNPFSVSSVVVDATNGSDSTGNRFGPAVKTLTRAKALAQSGDTILVLPGTYVENDLLKNGVNWHFLPGAVISFVESDGGTARGIFDDYAGACVSRITGALKIIHTYSLVNNTSFGTLVLTNAASDIYFQFDSMSIQNGFGNATAGLSIRSCSKCYVDFNVIFDPTFGAVTSPCSGIYWEKGDTYIKGKIIQVEAYAIWPNEPAGTPTTSIYCDVQLLNSNNGTAIYFVGLSANYRAWVNCLEAKSNVLGAVASFGAGGKLYVTAQKLSNAGNVSLTQAIVLTGGAGAVWITAQKVSSQYGWLNATVTYTGNAHITVMEYEDLTGIGAGFTVNGSGKINLHGGIAKVLNGKGVSHAAATLRIKHMTIDTTNTNAAGNTPAFLTASGIILDNCTLLAPALSNGLQGSAAGKTYKCYGTVSNLASDANCTAQVDALKVDANVS